jgi:general secretion pathway protein D
MINDLEEIVRTCDRPGFKFFDATGLDFGGGPGAVQYVGKHRTASELVAILGGTELGNVGVFLFPPFADDSTNSIYIVENPTDVADDIAALEMFDRPPLMMELEVAVYQIDDTNRGKLGVDWDVWKSFVTGSLEYSSVDLNEFFDDENDLFSTLLTLDARALVDFLSYTVQTGTTEIVTSTKLTMVNSEDNPGALSGGARGSSTGEPAVISVTTPIPFTVVQEDVGGTNSINARNEVVYDLFEGIQIKILPFIATESITLTVDVQVNSLVGFSPNADIPLIQERSLNSVVNLSNGAPVVLGGLDKQTSVKSRVGIPLLKEIPYLGLLFSKEKTETVTSKILISLTPRIKQFDSPSDTELAMGL